MAKIRYIGDKQERPDIHPTGIVWRGKGDVQDYPDDQAKIAALLRHYMIWELVLEDEQAPPPPEPQKPVLVPREDGELYFEHYVDGDGSLYRLKFIETGEVIDLSVMTNDQLKEFVRLNRIDADLHKKGDVLRAQIVASVSLAQERAAG